MPSLILNKIKCDFPDITFVEGRVFSWSPNSRTVTYTNTNSHDDTARLLHELAHAILGHSEYKRDILLINIERSAWEYAVNELAPRYQIKLNMNDDVVQDSLDSYRDWLHARSSCPKCQAVGIEHAKHRYRCLHCNNLWRVNEARSCQLRRYQK